MPRYYLRLKPTIDKANPRGPGLRGFLFYGKELLACLIPLLILTYLLTDFLGPLFFDSCYCDQCNPLTLATTTGWRTRQTE
jgi:hypothetical protein